MCKKRNKIAHSPSTSQEKKNPKVNDAGRSLACPFHKFDSFLFGLESPEPAYHICGTSKFSNVARLKQHLEKHHSFPKIRRLKCKVKSFTPQDTLLTDATTQYTCELHRESMCTAEIISPELAKRLKLGGRNKVDTNKEEYWYRVFDTLFPRCRKYRDISPYFNGPCWEFLESFLAYTQDVVKLFHLGVPIDMSLNPVEQYKSLLHRKSWPQLGCEPIQTSIEANSITQPSSISFSPAQAEDKASVVSQTPINASSHDHHELLSDPVPTKTCESMDLNTEPLSVFACAPEDQTGNMTQEIHQSSQSFDGQDIDLMEYFDYGSYCLSYHEAVPVTKSDAILPGTSIPGGSSRGHLHGDDDTDGR